MNDFDRFLLEHSLASDDTNGQIEPSLRQEANLSEAHVQEASHGQGIEATVDAQQQGDSDESQPMHEAVRDNGLNIPSPPFLRDVNAAEEQNIVPQRSHSGNNAGTELTPDKLPAILQAPLRRVHEPAAQSSSVEPDKAASQLGAETFSFAYKNGSGCLLLPVLVDRSMYEPRGTENPNPMPAKTATNPDVVYYPAVVNETLYSRPRYRNLGAYDPIAMHLDGKLDRESMDRISPLELWRMIGPSKVPSPPEEEKKEED